MWDSDPKTLQDAIDEALGPDAANYEIHYRAMFGGLMAYTHGRPFCSISNAGAAVKLPPDQAKALEEKGGYPLRYEPDAAPSKSYTVIPLAIVKAGGVALTIWLKASMDHCKNLPLKKRKPRKSK